MSFKSKLLIIKFQILVLFTFAGSSFAATIVNVQSNLGNFTLELYEDRAPATVAHFLANIEAGNYQFTMVHQVTSVWVSGGSYFYNSCSTGPEPVNALPAISVESTGLRNDNGTIGMVRSADDASTVSEQWVINLADNENVFDPNERPVVFGEVIEGLETVNIIADQWLVPMDVSPSVPTINYNGLSVNCNVFNRDNVVKVAMDIESVDPPASDEPANYFDEATSLLNIKVDAGSEGLLSLSLQLQATDPEVVVQAQPESVVALEEAVDGMAIFDAETGELSIPELVIDGETAYSNLVFLLTDQDNLFFTLQSFE